MQYLRAKISGQQLPCHTQKSRKRVYEQISKTVAVWRWLLIRSWGFGRGIYTSTVTWQQGDWGMKALFSPFLLSVACQCFPQTKALSEDNRCSWSYAHHFSEHQETRAVWGRRESWYKGANEESQDGTRVRKTGYSGCNIYAGAYFQDQADAQPLHDEERRARVSCAIELREGMH